MSDTENKIAPYGVKNCNDIPWYNSKGHTPGALSKKLVGRAHGADKIGLVLSCYAPGHYMDPHVHQEREQVYHILSGHGTLMIDGVPHKVGPGDIAYFPAGVWHGLYNYGTENLVFTIASGTCDAP